MTTHLVSSLEELNVLAIKTAANLEPGQVVLLFGEMGAGKTTFVSKIVDALHGVDPVSSPTFTLINYYRADIPIIHMDLYRLEPGIEVEMMDLDRYFRANSVALIEWPEKLGEHLIENSIAIKFEIISEMQRRIELPFEVT